MILTFDNYTITGTPQEIKEFIELYETKTTFSTGVIDSTILCPRCNSNKLNIIWTRMDENDKYQCHDCGYEFEETYLKNKNNL